MRSIKIGAGVTAERWTEQVFNYVPFTPLFNTPGNPAVPLPLHWTPGGLPVGVQWVGGLGDESTLLRVAAQLAQAMPWKKRTPPMHAGR